MSEYLLRLQQDFELISESLEEIASRMMSENISRFPVFVASRQPVALGIRIASPQTSGTAFIYHVSFLEELVKKGVVDASKTADFRKTYSDPFTNACILYIELPKTEFVFLPYDYTPYNAYSGN